MTRPASGAISPLPLPDSHWDPAAYLANHDDTIPPTYAVCVLNQPIQNREMFLSICEKGE